jgi:hypothetical protein
MGGNEAEGGIEGQATFHPLFYWYFCRLQATPERLPSRFPEFSKANSGVLFGATGA